MQLPSSDRVTLATLNTLGIHVVKSRLPSRYKLIAEGLEKGNADVVCLQEIATYWHLWLLTSRMPSFRYVSYQRAALGPAGAVVTFSRLPLAGTDYHRLGPPRGSAAVARLPPRNRLTAGLRGALATRLAGSAAASTGLTIVNTHTTSNMDADWSPTNRHYLVQQVQLASIGAVLQGIGGPAVLCGDFNVPRQDPLLKSFLDDAGLSDAFGGTCPPTFRAEYLPPGDTAHCVDFILTSPGVRVESRSLLFADKHPSLPAPGYLSDHIGLTATLSVPAT